MRLLGVSPQPCQPLRDERLEHGGAPLQERQQT
jgi:hypothetical protein